MPAWLTSRDNITVSYCCPFLFLYFFFFPQAASPLKKDNFYLKYQQHDGHIGTIFI